MGSPQLQVPCLNRPCASKHIYDRVRLRLIKSGIRSDFSLRRYGNGRVSCECNQLSTAAISTHALHLVGARGTHGTSAVTLYWMPISAERWSRSQCITGILHSIAHAKPLTGTEAYVSQCWLLFRISQCRHAIYI